MMHPVSNPYSALLDYYKIVLPGCPIDLQPAASLPPQPQSSHPMSSALSYAATPADPEMNDLALAVGHKHTRTHRHTHAHSHSDSSLGASPAPAVAMSAAACAEDPAAAASSSAAETATNSEGTLDHAQQASTLNIEAQPGDATAPETNGGSGEAASPSADTAIDAAAAGGEASLQSSLLLKPLARAAPGAVAELAPSNAAETTSMATPQSLQDSSCISPLDMLIAALDPKNPQKQPPSGVVSADPSLAQQPLSNAHMPATCSIGDNSHSGSSSVGSTNEAGSGGSSALSSLPANLWNPVSAAPQEYACGMQWAAAAETQAGGIRRASDGAFLGSYQLGRPQDESDPSPLQGFGGARDIRKASYPPGIKRPYSDFDHLLSAADMYTGAGHHGSAFSTATDPPAPSKQARYSTIAGSGVAGYADPTSSPYQAANGGSAVDSAAAAAAAAAAASMAYSTAAFPYSTKRSTALASPGRENPPTQQYLSTCFESLNTSGGLSLDAGMSMISGPPLPPPHLSQPLHLIHHHSHSQHAAVYPKSGAHHMMPPIPTSLHLASPVAAAATAVAAHHAPAGYFYDGTAPPLPPASSGAGAAGSFMVAPNPIPAIPGVTVSPKEKPRRVSIPDLTPTAEEEQIGPKARPRRQKLRFADDLYTPMWVRNNGQQKEGFCDTCSPGKWLQLKNSAYWYHKQFFHGISSVSGCPFVRPLQIRHFDADIIEGLCHQCQQWVPIANAKRRNSVLWFRHAHKCHVYHKPKPDGELESSGSNSGATGSSGSGDAMAYLPSPQSQMPVLPPPSNSS